MRWWSRLIRRERLERELDRELRFHVDEEVRRLVDDGMPERPRRGSGRWRLSAGSSRCGSTRATRAGRRWVEDLWKDVRYAGRMMRRHAGFTIAAIVSLAIGIGANAAVFSVADALILRRAAGAAARRARVSETRRLRRADPALLAPDVRQVPRRRARVPLAAMGSVGRACRARRRSGAELRAWPARHRQLVRRRWRDRCAGAAAHAGRHARGRRRAGGRPQPRLLGPAVQRRSVRARRDRFG